MKKRKIKIRWDNIAKLIFVILLTITFLILFIKGIEKDNQNYIQKNDCIKKANNNALEIYNCYEN